MMVGVRHVIQTGEFSYELETVVGERVRMVYNGVVLTLLYKSEHLENLSFSVERRGLGTLDEFLSLAGFELSADCMLTF